MQIDWRCSDARRAGLLAALVAVAAWPGGERALHAQTVPKVYYACYVPLTGTVYRIKESDVKATCTSASHVEFSWTDGANALRVTDPAGGDLTGVLSNASVVKLLGRALATTTPAAGQVLSFDGTAWTPSTLPSASLPAATGDVSGTYPGITVTGLQGKPVSPTLPTTGQVLGFNGTAWQATAPSSGGGGVTSHGALTGLLNDDHPQYLMLNGARIAPSGIAVSGIQGVGVIPIAGPGIRMMWYPRKVAFRAGQVDSDQWDDNRIGPFSTATGFGTIASGSYSTAFGQSTVANGNNSTAIGQNTVASGNNSTAIGQNTDASGDNATTMGRLASTGGFSGSFVYGDASTGAVVAATAANQFTARASGGFRFRTSPTLDTGCDITAGNLSCTGMLFASGGILASGSGAIPAQGPGVRMMWYPNKGAFRTGQAWGNEWDDGNIGVNSFATGTATIASGQASTAMGFQTEARGRFAMAMGEGTRASGDNSMAMGAFTTANADHATAMGRAATSGRTGSFVYGDASTNVDVVATAPHQFTVRASGGFRFRTSSDLSTGCDLAAGSGTWSCTSSRLAKERFENLNGDDVLAKIASMPIQTWSYKTEPGNVRHVGPTAQDFRAAFGLGNSDEAISLVDIDGINLLGVQALERRAKVLEQENAELRDRLGRLEAALKRLENPDTARAASRTP